VLLVTSLYTFTSEVCPILCALAVACISFCGFQSESYIITVSADAKFIPIPPAFVDNKNISAPVSLLLNLSIDLTRLI